MMLPRARSFALIIQPRHLNDHQKAALFYVTPGTGVTIPERSIRSYLYLAKTLYLPPSRSFHRSRGRRRRVCRSFSAERSCEPVYVEPYLAVLVDRYAAAGVIIFFVRRA